MKHRRTTISFCLLFLVCSVYNCTTKHSKSESDNINNSKKYDTEIKTNESEILDDSTVYNIQTDDEKILANFNGRSVYIKHDSWADQFRNVWNDTTLCEHRLSWCQFESLDTCNLVNPYENTGFEEDTIVYYYGTSGKFIITKLNTEFSVSDTIILNNQLLRKYADEYYIKNGYFQDGYTLGYKFDLNNISAPICINDTIRFTIYANRPDTDEGIYYYYDIINLCDTLYVTEDIWDDFESDY